ncbi:MAG: ATP-binding protein [Verrucomicrobiae bacterium]|nr:ATP-binding protein [Verrucomicrobiae bacterium]
MSKFFNTTGPCDSRRHYMLPPQGRLPGLSDLIRRGDYFVIHAARQSGKTTLILDLERELNAGGEFCAVYCNVEPANEIADPKEGLPAIARSIAKAVRRSHLVQAGLEAMDARDYTNVVNETLVQFAESCSKPVVLLFDEVDCLRNGTLIGFLRQLRDGYITRSKTPFPHSIALVGMRNIRDYKARIRENRDALGSASPFNIVAEALTLRNFSGEEVAQLYQQHTAETRQCFAVGVVDWVMEKTCGQPWLVNAVARECVEKILKNDFSKEVTVELVDQAIQNIILRRDTHIDSLLERLKEERVRRVVEPLITGQQGEIQRSTDDYQYVKDLGLIRDDRRMVEPGCPIYAEVMVRTLTADLQGSLESPIYPYALARYRMAQGLNMGLILEDFQQFWRENSGIWREKFDYKEAAPHLILMAFLQRVVNGGGRIDREMAAESRRLDLCVELDKKRYPIELKLRSAEKTEEEGIAQLMKYLDILGAGEGWLLIFDRREEVSWDQKIYRKEVSRGTKTIHVFGC